MLEAIKASNYRVKWNLRQVHKITQYKDGCVYRTKSIGMIVCRPEYRLLDMADVKIGSVSTTITKEIC